MSFIGIIIRKSNRLKHWIERTKDLREAPRPPLARRSQQEQLPISPASPEFQPDSVTIRAVISFAPINLTPNARR